MNGIVTNYICRGIDQVSKLEIFNASLSPFTTNQYLYNLTSLTAYSFSLAALVQKDENGLGGGLGPFSEALDVTVPPGGKLIFLRLSPVLLAALPVARIGDDLFPDLFKRDQEHMSHRAELFPCMQMRAPSEPQYVTIEYTRTNLSHLTWKPPKSVKGQLESYELELIDDGVISQKVILQPDVEAYTFEGLAASTKYILTIAGRTKADNNGQGGGLGAKFTIPIITSPNGEMQRMEFVFCTLYSSPARAVGENEPLSQFLMDRIAGNINWYTSLIASNLEASRVIPGPPSDLQIFEVDAKFIVIQWQPPKEGGKVVTSYEAVISTTTPDIVVATRTIKATSLLCNFTNLLPNTEYKIKVLAKIEQIETSTMVLAGPYSDPPFTYSTYPGRKLSSCHGLN
ncbi:unnamed protein product [Protopolystoma xenopodis]|uniref:Fibronectin type-III domain-containing protein n=1 Tax=Protopolystoma xenopodis TaxID=117903 RepID=A0A448XDL2_9PLAT|nr:unnamed protein product [Protopolystoma xenopodis]